MLTALHEIWPRLAYGTVILGLAGALGLTWSRLWAVRAERDRERRGREEMEAYTRLDVRMMRNSDLAMLGRTSLRGDRCQKRLPPCRASRPRR